MADHARRERSIRRLRARCRRRWNLRSRVGQTRVAITSSFVQCDGSQLPGQLDTTSYSNGQHTLTYGASNAAGVVSAPSKTISIDNAPVSLSLTGPSDALSTAGTQHVDAYAGAGPSGVAAVFCSVDEVRTSAMEGPQLRCL